MELLFTASPHIRSDVLSVPTFRMLAVRKPRGWDPSTKRHLCWPEGGTVTIHPAHTAARAARLARRLRSLRCGLEHGPLRHEAGGQEAPQRHDQLTRQRNDGDASDAAAALAGSLVEPAAEGAPGLMSQPQPG